MTLQRPKLSNGRLFTNAMVLGSSALAVPAKSLGTRLSPQYWFGMSST